MMGESSSVINEWKADGMCFRLLSFKNQGQTMNYEQTNEEAPCSREYTHELFIRLEWFTFLKLDFPSRHVFEICCERCEMEGIIPLPRGCLVWPLVSSQSNTEDD